jgi:hypothetical protein
MKLSAAVVTIPNHIRRHVFSFRVVHSRNKTKLPVPYIWGFIPRNSSPPEGGKTSILLRDALFAFNACRKIAKSMKNSFIYFSALKAKDQGRWVEVDRQRP